ncbi:MAG: rhomboid family intramembrane serine protease [Candidatus Altiarchaeota archaeon]|nr:rhomboid family intramembrane serine protease [Candidatus Altiarchaeota archaeon]
MEDRDVIEGLKKQARLKYSEGFSVEDLRRWLKAKGVSPGAGSLILLEFDDSIPGGGKTNDWKSDFKDTNWRETKWQNRQMDSGLNLGLKPIIITIILINLLIFSYLHWIPQWQQERFVSQYGFTPEDLLPNTLLTSIFIHVELPHFLFNMLFLYFLGCMIEHRLGKVKFVLLYIFSGVFANLIYAGYAPSLGISTYTTAIGASGAVFGVIGAGLLYKPLARTPVFLIPVLGQILLVFSLPIGAGRWVLGSNKAKNLLVKTTPYALVGLSYLAFWFLIAATKIMGEVAQNVHLGGFIIGFFLFPILDGIRRSKRPKSN